MVLRLHSVVYFADCIFFQSYTSSNRQYIDRKLWLITRYKNFLFCLASELLEGA